MSLDARQTSDCARGAEVVAAEDGAGLAEEAGGLDCASAGMIITEASNPPIKSFERMENLQVGGYETFTNASPTRLFLELCRGRQIFFHVFAVQKFRIVAGNNRFENWPRSPLIPDWTNEGPGPGAPPRL